MGGVAEGHKPANGPWQAGDPEANFTDAQWASLERLVRDMRAKYRQPGGFPKVIGHRDVPGVHKACPSFEVRAWAEEKGLIG